MTAAWPDPVQRVQEELAASGLEGRIKTLTESTRTSELAAEAVGCEVAQICKSLVFRGKKSNQGVMVLASGANRVSPQAVSGLMDEPVKMADPGLVLEMTGFAVGGVPPVGHRQAMPFYIDEDLLKFETIWAAGGTTNTMFSLTPAELLRLTEGTPAAVKA